MKRQSTGQSTEQSTEPSVPDTYQIALIVPLNGTLTADKESATIGETVALTVSPADGYELIGITVNGEALEGLTFVMPAEDVTIAAEFKAIVYTITITDCENGTLTANKLSATMGETITLSATPATAYRLVAIRLDGQALGAYTFTMPSRNVTVSAEFAEIFAKGENFGYAGGFISTSGVDVSSDSGEYPVTSLNGGYEQYAYCNDVLAEKLYFETKINVRSALNDDEYPKFGLFLETADGRIAFYAAMTPQMTATTVGRVYFDGTSYLWSGESLALTNGMAFTGEDKVTFALVRDGSGVYFYVNGTLAMYEENSPLLGQGKLSAVGVFSFNTVLDMSDYSVKINDEAENEIASAKADVLRLHGETYGTAGSYTTSVGVDLTYDRGETPYVLFNGNGSPQFAYIADIFASRNYYEADFTVMSVKNGDAYPKFGMYAQTEEKTLYFYVDMSTELTATTVGAVYVRNGAWDWANARTASVSGMAFTGDDSVKLAVSRNGEDFIFLVNGAFALSVPHSELGDTPSAFGAFGFNTEMKVAATALDDSEEKAAEVKALLPKVGYSKNGVGYSLNDYIYDPETDTISLMHASSNVRAIATYYVDGIPVYYEAFAIQGKVRIFNTKTTGTAASKVELQVGRNTSNFFKMYIYRFEASTTNDSIYIEGANQKDNGNIVLKRIKYNTLPAGDDCTLDYKVIYDHGTVYLVIDDEVQLIYETGWKEAGYSFGVLQYADTVWSETIATLDETAVIGLAETYKNDYLAYKAAEELSEDVALSAGNEITLISGSDYRVGGTLLADGSSTGKTSVYVNDSSATVAEYALSKTSDNKWLVERTAGGATETILPPANDSCGWMNFEVAVGTDGAAFMLNGKVYDIIYFTAVGDVTVSAGVTGGNALLYKTYVQQFDTAADADEYVSSAPVYAYYSNYSSRINSLYNEYIASGDSVTGGVLILGSSTMDFWDNWAEDLSLTDKKTGYNVGIGGTTSEDWLFAYDKLVKPFAPSCVLIFVGGNDLGVNGARAVDTADRIERFIERLHGDFPNADIYYIYSLACPSSYAGGRWTKHEYELLVNTLKAYCDSTDIVTGIDVNGVLTDGNGDPAEGYFRSDGIHMTEIGYAAWTAYLLDVIEFPSTLGKRYITSEFDGVASCYATFNERFVIDLTGTDYEGNEGLTLSVIDEKGDTVPVTRNGDVFAFMMPATNVTLSATISVRFTNAVWTDNGTLIKGAYNSFAVAATEMTIPSHYAYESLYELLPDAIKTSNYVYGYSVSSDGGETFGDIITDIGLVALSENDILKVHFVMMGSAASGNSNYNQASFDALADTLTLGSDENLSSTRYWGALYKDGTIYTGNNYTVTMRLTLTKPDATRNFVAEIQVSNMPAKDVYRGRKVYLRFEKNATVLKRQMTETLTAGYNAGWTKTNTAITVESIDVLSITLDVTIVVTPEGFTLTVVNVNDTDQTYSETYVFSDDKYAWENVNVCLADVQIGKVVVSNITFTDNSASGSSS